MRSPRSTVRRSTKWSSTRSTNTTNNNMKTKFDSATIHHIKKGLLLRIVELEKLHADAVRYNVVETIPIWNEMLSEARNALQIIQNNRTFTAGE